jgi:hypothetical protein
MLVCGEDLGFVPACLPPVMSELGLVGLRIQRMPSAPGAEFANPAEYPYLSVASPSCHDVAPLRAWWEEDAERAERFYYTQLGGAGPPPAACTPAVARAVLQQHFSCPSVFVIAPVQDVMALAARYAARPAQQEVINDPTTAKHYWRYRYVGVCSCCVSMCVCARCVRRALLCKRQLTRTTIPQPTHSMHVTLEELTADAELIGLLQDMLLMSDRARPSDLPLAE